VAQAAHHLGIDAKTLRRWLADAQLPLQSHPHDGRKKGMSHEHLQVLARLHQRSLALLPPEPPARGAAEPLPLPTALLSLPETVDTLQTQIAALQHQVAALTHLLQLHEHRPALLAAPAKPSRTTKRPSKQASSAPRARPAASATAKTPRKPVHVIPRVEYGP